MSCHPSHPCFACPGRSSLALVTSSTHQGVEQRIRREISIPSPLKRRSPQGGSRMTQLPLHCAAYAATPSDQDRDDVGNSVS